MGKLFIGTDQQKCTCLKKTLKDSGGGNPIPSENDLFHISPMAVFLFNQF